MEKHFVTFYSPGTFVAETSEKPIESWNVDIAMEMAREIIERYDATPYAFIFTTRARGPADLDSKIVKRSGRYFLGGTVRTLKEVQRDNLPDEHILLRNMECNGYKRVITNKNSWEWKQPLEEGDCVLNFEAKKKIRK